MSNPEIDLLVVHGKNLGVGSTRQDIQDRKYGQHLSIDSEMNVLAAGELYQPGTTILLSGGHTVGPAPEFESQPCYAEAFLRRRFPNIPDEAIVLDESGFDTAASAEHVSKLYKDGVYSHIGLLSVGYHIKNTATLFRHYGVTPVAVISAEEVVRHRSAHHEDYVSAWKNSDRIKKETQRELVRTLLLHTVDRRGLLLRRLTQGRTKH